MRLVIHCGCHKTATTTFQRFCDLNRALLLQARICYPKYREHDQHSNLMWRIQREGTEAFGRFLRDAVAAQAGAFDTLLLSGEDFENAIVDLALAQELEAQAHAAGFEDIRWVVVTRRPEDYAKAIYAEKSKHNVVLSKDIVQQALSQRGCLYVATRYYNYIFVLDYARFADRFANAVAGRVWHFTMQDFVTGGVGDVLLRKLMTPELYAAFSAAARTGRKVANARVPDHLVEQKYMANALGLRDYRRWKLHWRWLLALLARLRRP
jgi:hypothetical protein